MSCSSQLKTYTGEQIKVKGRPPVESCSGQLFRSQFIRMWLAQSNLLGLVIHVPQICPCNPITKMPRGHWPLSLSAQGWTWAHQGNPGSIWGGCICPAQVLSCSSSALRSPLQSWSRAGTSWKEQHHHTCQFEAGGQGQNLWRIQTHPEPGYQNWSIPPAQNWGPFCITVEREVILQAGLSSCVPTDPSLRWSQGADNNQHAQRLVPI